MTRPKKREGDVLVSGGVSESYATKWDDDGQAWSQRNDGPWERTPHLDFGSPMGDVLIDPWIQDILKKQKRGEDTP